MANRSRSGRLDPADRIEETRRLRDQGLIHRDIAERLDVSVSTVGNDLRARSSEGERAAAAPPSKRPSGASAARVKQALAPTTDDSPTAGGCCPNSV